MENKPEQNSPVTTTDTHAKDTCKWLAWIDTHGSRIQTATAFVQATVAIFMCVSLIQSCKAIHESHQTLLLTQRQLESMIEPRVDITYGSNDFAMLRVDVPPNTHTSEITNISVPKFQLETFIKGCTNFTRVNFKNEGTVSISDLKLLMAIEIDTDVSSNVKEMLTDYRSELLAKCLKPDENVWHYFGNDPAIKRLINLRPPNSQRRALCFVVKYSRSVDMKPEVRYIFFLNSTVAGDTNPFAIPFSQKTGAPIVMNAAAMEIRSRFEDAVRKVVQQADVLDSNLN